MSAHDPKPSCSFLLHRQVFSVEDCHHHIVMPGTIDERGLALSSLDDKATLLIRADGPQVVVHHPHGDAMQLENIECIAQSKSDSLTAEALSELTGVFNPDC
jgi:hypothetical protein